MSCTLAKDKLEELLDRRLKLLALGDELSEVRSIMDIEGIIFELSRSNIGSHVCQKLLSIASLN
jgi:hypothetical protein